MSTERGCSTEGAASFAVLIALLCLAHVSQMVLHTTILVVSQPMKLDLNLSDAQVGLLMGLAYSLTAGLFALPFGVAADRYSRAKVLGIAVSIMATAGYGMALAVNFIQLLAARLVSGVGDAGIGPPCISLLSDRIPVRMRPLALAAYDAGIPLGNFATYFVLGIVSYKFGWRTAFQLGAWAGILIAALCVICLKDFRSEPVKKSAGQRRFDFLRSPVYRHCLFAFIASGFMSGATWNWTAPILIRSYGLTVAGAGQFLGIGIGVANLTGSIVFGLVMTFARKYSASAPLIVSAAAYLTSSLLFAAALAADRVDTTKLLLIGSLFTSATVFVAVMTSLPEVVLAPSRASAVALAYLLLAVLGQGLGPLFTGWLSDLLAPQYGVEALRICVRYVNLIGWLWVCGHLVMAALHLRRLRFGIALPQG